MVAGAAAWAVAGRPAFGRWPGRPWPWPWWRSSKRGRGRVAGAAAFGVVAGAAAGVVAGRPWPWPWWPLSSSRSWPGWPGRRLRAVAGAAVAVAVVAVVEVEVGAGLAGVAGFGAGAGAAVAVAVVAVVQLEVVAGLTGWLGRPARKPERPFSDGRRGAGRVGAAVTADTAELTGAVAELTGALAGAVTVAGEGPWPRWPQLSAGRKLAGLLRVPAGRTEQGGHFPGSQIAICIARRAMCRNVAWDTSSSVPSGETDLLVCSAKKEDVTAVPAIL